MVTQAQRTVAKQRAGVHQKRQPVGARVWKIFTSCKQRRLGEYEGTSWWEFVDAEQRSASYQKFLASGITRSLVAAKARTASTRTIGDIFVQLMLTILNPITTDRVLDGPTNLVWIDSWRTYLESAGVRYEITTWPRSRSNAPTMHRRAGVPIAVNAGDAMNALGMRFFRKTGERLGPTATLGGSRTCRGRGERVLHSSPFAGVLQVPTSNGCALA